MSDWAKSAIGSGVGVLTYEWLYVPLCKGWGIEAWSMTSYGIFLLCVGTVLTVIASAYNFQKAHH
jgi:hypothetical protein